MQRYPALENKSECAAKWNGTTNGEKKLSMTIIFHGKYSGSYIFFSLSSPQHSRLLTTAPSIDLKEWPQNERVPRNDIAAIRFLVRPTFYSFHSTTPVLLHRMYFTWISIFFLPRFRFHRFPLIEITKKKFTTISFLMGEYLLNYRHFLGPHLKLCKKINDWKEM